MSEEFPAMHTDAAQSTSDLWFKTRSRSLEKGIRKFENHEKLAHYTNLGLGDRFIIDYYCQARVKRRPLSSGSSEASHCVFETSSVLEKIRY